MRRIPTTLLIAVTGLACAAYAADQAARSLLPAEAVAAFRLSEGAGDYARMATTAVPGQAFKSALRIEVTKKPQRAQQVTVSTPVDAAIANGDVLMVSFWMRSGAPGEATLDAAFRAPMAVGARGARGGVPGAPGAAGPPPAGVPPAGAPGAPPAGAPGAQGAAGTAGRGAAGGGGFVGGFGFGGRGGLNAPAASGVAWKKITLPFAVNRDYAKGESEVAFTLGMKEQTVEIGGIELLNYGTSRKVADLPFTRIGYQGSEPTAAWRKAAEARIEKTRKGNLTVVVKDEAGKPVSGAQVAVRMKKHAFLWGTAVNASAFSNGRMTPENLERYKQQILENFNFSVMENENKWPQWSNAANRPATIKVIDWLRENGVQVRGHNLVWPSWNNSNVKEAVDAKGNPSQLAKVILDHISEATRELRGKFVDWDVINETFTNHDFMDILGRQVMVDWFKAARAGDPDAKLYINDFNVIEGDDKAHQDDYAATIKYLLDAGAPVDGIGLQSHFPSRVTPIDELIRRVERYAAFGKELEVTEFDINTSDEGTQADYTRDFMTYMFSNPSVKAFVLWGFWEGAHWIPSGAMMRRDWSLKPNGTVYRDLVFKKWWTNADGKTGAKGTFTTRAFLGDFDIEVKAGGKTRTVKASLGKDGKTVECVLE
jgi:endo-1,4-beta-xylanase